MKHFERILVAVDASEDSRRAFDYALEYCRLIQTNTLVIVTVFETNQLNVFEFLTPEAIDMKRKEAERILDRYKELAIEQGIIAIEAILEEGAPADRILRQVIPSFQPDFLICGSSSNEHKQQLFIGSQAAALAKNAPCSVMIVR